MAVVNIPNAKRTGGSLYNPTAKVLGGRHEHALRSTLGGKACNPTARDLGGRLLDPTAMDLGNSKKGQISKFFQTRIKSQIGLEKWSKHEI